MNRLAKLAFSLLLVTIIFSAGTIAFAADTKATLTPSKTNLDVKGTVTVTVAIKDVTDLYGVQFGLEFDAKKLILVNSSFAEGYSNYNQHGCQGCETGKTPIYPLLRSNSKDTAAKEQVKLAEFTFEALEAGTAQVKLVGLKAVSSKTVKKPSGITDIVQIPVTEAASLSITINEGKPGNGNPGNGGLQKLLKEILAEEDVEVAAARMTDWLNTNTLANPGSKNLVEKAVEELLGRLLVYSDAETVRKDNKSFYTMNAKVLQSIIKKSEALRSAVKQADLDVDAYLHLSIEEKKDFAVLLTPELMKMLSEAGLDFAVKTSNTTHYYSIASIYKGGNTDVELEIKQKKNK